MMSSLKTAEMPTWGNVKKKDLKYKFVSTTKTSTKKQVYSTLLVQHDMKIWHNTKVYNALKS